MNASTRRRPHARRSRPWSALLPAAALLLVGPTAAGAQADPGAAAGSGSELRIWLVTAGPGPAVWERFGHNAIRVLDTATGTDVSYNWGIFDFDQVDFVPRFLRGEMLYMMAAFPTAPMIDSYLRADRRVTLQELNLTPAQRAELDDLLEWNALPENRDYFYDYFLDNCSTRARDALDQVLGGALRTRFSAEETGTSYRFHTRRLTRMDAPLYTGMDLLLGTPGDQPVSVWEEMFLPMTLMEELRDVTVAGADGSERPIVVDERVLTPPGSTEEPAHPWGPPAPPSWLLGYLALGLGLGGLMASLGTRAAEATAASGSGRIEDGTPGGRLVRVAAGAGAAVWSVAAGFVGTVLVLVLFTDHQFMAWNENLFLFNPLSVGLALLAPMALAGTRGVRAARWLARAVVAVALLGLLFQLAPWSRQENAIFFALALPVHLGLALALERRATLADPWDSVRPVR